MMTAMLFYSYPYPTKPWGQKPPEADFLTVFFSFLFHFFKPCFLVRGSEPPAKGKEGGRAQDGKRSKQRAGREQHAAGVADTRN